ncbi:MAG: hypothetical protein VKI81_10730 [Synechococcaceae cyanobacterium]|nr:hypothetical protein [Synechococcaceae cyanobacterium]
MADLMERLRASGPHRIRLCGVPLVLVVLPACDGGRVCCAPSPPPSALRVTTVTTGGDIDPDGYTVVAMHYQAGLDSLSSPIDANGTIVLYLNPVTYWVSLEDVRANCLVVDPHPCSVGLAQGETVATTFEVRCE